MAFTKAWRTLRTFERLLEFEAAQTRNLDALKSTIASLEVRLTRLETREEMVIVEARSAARAGAADAMSGVMLQIGERLGALEARVAGSKRLPVRTRENPPG